MSVAVLVHLTVSTLAAIALGLITGRITSPIALVSLVLGAIAGAAVWRGLRNNGERRLPDITFFPALLSCVILFAGLQHFLYLLYYDRHSLKTLHLNNFGDLSMHIHYIRHMASGAAFWPQNPGYAGELLRYPLGMDLYNALWEVLGVPTDSHLFGVGLVMTVIAVALLHRWMGWWGVGAFFLNGGFSNWQCLWKGRIYDFQNEVAWKNFFLSLWITQRGFLFAIPAGAYVMRTVTEHILGERVLTRNEKRVCTLLWSGLAWFHLHSFFIVTLVIALFMVVYKKVRTMAGIFIPSVLGGLLFVIFSTDSFARVGVMHLQPKWVAGQQNVFAFWFVNLGPWLFLWLATLFMLLKKPTTRLLPIAIALSALFVTFTVVMLAPWDWDNIKILLWIYLVMAWLMWKTWVNRLSAITAFVIGSVVFFPGAVSLVSSLPGNTPGIPLYRAEELWESKAALRDLPKGSVLAVSPDPNHPAMFWGTVVTMAYPGHLWSHGIQFSERKGKLDALLKGRADWPFLAREIRATHIYWGEHEKKKYGVFNPPWRPRLKNISPSSRIEVYELRGFQNTQE